ncbi:MAG: diacylglycerol kinase family protein [Chloroflexota bacterium]
MRQATVVYNPYAGQVNLSATVELVADMWRARGWDVHLQPTQWAGHAKALAQEAAKAGIDVVLAAGGDGTLGEVAHGIVGSNTILAPLPVGTSNSFARELQLPRPTWFARNRLLETAALLLDGRVQQMDMGYLAVTDRHWLLWAGVGADGYIVENIEPRPLWSKRLGKLGYTIQALAVAWRMPRMKVDLSVDDRSQSGTYLLVLISNTRLYAGGELLMNKTAQLDDGQFDIWLFEGTGLLHALSYIWQIKRGKEEIRGLHKLNGRSITITATPNVLYQIDGEKGGHTPLTCELKPRALRLLVPQTTPADLFKEPGQPL